MAFQHCAHGKRRTRGNRRPHPPRDRGDLSSSPAARGTTQAMDSSSPGISTSVATTFRVLLWAHPMELSGDAATNFQILTQTGVAIEFFGLEFDASRLEQQLAGAAWIVDGPAGYRRAGRTTPAVGCRDRCDQRFSPPCGWPSTCLAAWTATPACPRVTRCVLLTPARSLGPSQDSLPPAPINTRASSMSWTSALRRD